MKVKNTLMTSLFLKTRNFLHHKALTDWLESCRLLVDYYDVFISCLDSHSDGTHSLQRIHWWCNAKFLQICYGDETNSFKSWVQIQVKGFHSHWIGFSTNIWTIKPWVSTKMDTDVHFRLWIKLPKPFRWITISFTFSIRKDSMRVLLSDRFCNHSYMAILLPSLLIQWL